MLRVEAAQAALLARRGDLAAIEGAAVFKRDAAAAGLDRVAEARVPLADTETARLIAFRPRDGGSEHLAILIGAPDPAAPVLVRLHSECFTGDLLASLRLDRGDQLRAATAQAGGGVLLYLAQEGRRIGLINELRSYHLQDAGFDTLDANAQLGFDVDERIYLPAARLRDGPPVDQQPGQGGRARAVWHPRHRTRASCFPDTFSEALTHNMPSHRLTSVSILAMGPGWHLFSGRPSLFRVAR